MYVRVWKEQRHRENRDGKLKVESKKGRIGEAEGGGEAFPGGKENGAVERSRKTDMKLEKEAPVSTLELGNVQPIPPFFLHLQLPFLLISKAYS